MNVGDKVTIMSGKIICISEYPKLGLTYYGIKYYCIARRRIDIVFIEKNKLGDL